MLIIGHRGAKGLAPENTLAALEAGITAGADMLEIDVRVSLDGTALLCHDPFVIDKEGRKIFVDKTAFLDLQSIKPDILTLEAALQFIDRRTDVIVEIKPGVDIGPVVSSIEPRINKSWLESDLILASFDFKLLRNLHEKFPTIPVAILEKWSGVRASRRARVLGTKRLIMNERWLWRGFIHSMTRSGYLLCAYTINNPKRARRFEGAGLYGCITDFPNQFSTTK